MNFDIFRFKPKSSEPNDSGELIIVSKRRWPIVVAIISGIVIMLAAASIGWYKLSERPVDTSSTSSKQTITVTQGMTPSQIGQLLHDSGLIRNVLTYRIYIKLHGIENMLQAGIYKISPSENLSEVLGHLTSGETETFTITFYPGSTLNDPTDIEDAKRTDVYTMLRRSGYSDSDVRSALSTLYDSPLFQDKPIGTSLEGYVYGETYRFATTATVESILEHTFGVYYQAIEKYDIINGAKKQGLNLYQAITLASIVQREVSNYQDMRKVAQVFYSRLEKDMTLGSDVTFIYAAQQLNQTPTVDFPSAYNTRLNKGLPPGPISNPGVDALRAVANPASTKYLYFVAGEDGKTYFSYTQAEHEQNVEKHCGDLCN